MKSRNILMAAVALASIGPASAAALAQDAGAPPLQAQAEQIVAKVSGEWGVLAWSIDSGQPLMSINADRLFIPASNNKVFSSVWALDLLGADHRFPTDLLVTGPIQNGVLRGDVVIRGSGDPAFGYPEFTDDPMDPLRIMAQQLYGRGVRSVEGAVVGDPMAFDTILIGPAWPRDTGGGAAHYAPRVSGLPFQRNVISIRASAAPGGGTLLQLSPAVQVVPVVSRARRGGGRAFAVREPNSDTIEVRGTVSGGVSVYRVGVSNPALMTTDALRTALIEAGIQVAGGARLAATPEGAKLIHRHYSIPLSAMVRVMNNESDNFFAEHVWKAASRKAIGQGSYLRGGPASALHFHQAAGVPIGELYQSDGSGLSLHNRATPNAMVHALVHAHEAAYSKAFHSSLAVAGERSGTLRRLFTSTSAAGNLHAKTGYINDVRTLSGYVTATSGELIAFCFFYNGRGTSPARGVQTELGNLLAGWGGGPVAGPQVE
jgi:serine-type D-Ala-D-Ala carboxypeptidase/endopeptidase (penicillin-binding protein 4)